jgi:hypothetical protein
VQINELVEYEYEFQVSDSNSIVFNNNSLTYPSLVDIPKFVDPQLAEILLDPSPIKLLHASPDNQKIFLGFGARQPNSRIRVPMWISPKILFSSVLIGGSIGSGKSTLIARLLAGSLNCGLTTIIGEAKGGLDINPQSSAFSKLTLYLAQRIDLKERYYRWPRGNCYFNPLLYLNNFSERKTFMNSIASQSSATGEIEAYVSRAANIAAYILEILETLFGNRTDREQISLRNLVMFLKQPEGTLEWIENIKANNALVSYHLKIDNFHNELERLNFFELASANGRERFAMTMGGINFFTDLLDEEDLLYYTEPHTHDREGNELKKLELDDILYDRALVVISQPLASNHPSAKIVGPIFWDALLNHTLKIGLPDRIKSDRKRQDLAVFLDETHRLPTGRVGDSGDFLREYRVGIVEITPAIIDRERWERNKHVYQTIISTSPGVSEVCDLMHDRLPSHIPQLEVGIDVNMTSDRKMRIDPTIINRQYESRNQDNPGIFPRSLRSTGRYTALFQTADPEINANGLFWLDLESPILAKLNDLLEEALQGKKGAAKVIDYALGLIQEYP